MARGIGLALVGACAATLLACPRGGGGGAASLTVQAAPPSIVRGDRIAVRAELANRTGSAVTAERPFVYDVVQALTVDVTCSETPLPPVDDPVSAPGRSAVLAAGESWTVEIPLPRYFAFAAAASGTCLVDVTHPSTGATAQTSFRVEASDPAPRPVALLALRALGEADPTHEVVVRARGGRDEIVYSRRAPAAAGALVLGDAAPGVAPAAAAVVLALPEPVRYLLGGTVRRLTGGEAARRDAGVRVEQGLPHAVQVEDALIDDVADRIAAIVVAWVDGGQVRAAVLGRYAPLPGIPQPPRDFHPPALQLALDLQELAVLLPATTLPAPPGTPRRVAGVEPDPRGARVLVELDGRAAPAPVVLDFAALGLVP